MNTFQLSSPIHIFIIVNPMRQHRLLRGHSAVHEFELNKNLKWVHSCSKHQSLHLMNGGLTVSIFLKLLVPILVAWLISNVRYEISFRADLLVSGVDFKMMQQSKANSWLLISEYFMQHSHSFSIIVLGWCGIAKKSCIMNRRGDGLPIRMATNYRYLCVFLGCHCLNMVWWFLYRKRERTHILFCFNVSLFFHL